MAPEWVPDKCKQVFEDTQVTNNFKESESSSFSKQADSTWVSDIGLKTQKTQILELTHV